jgi:hypothetical protein
MAGRERFRPMKRALFALLLAFASAAFAWTPPPNPDPQQILFSAVEDRQAGRYEDALAKHLWFHREALRIRPSLAAVRRSFALAYWAHLGSKYPPALDALKKVRDEAGEDVRKGREPVDAFGDYARINDELDDPLATVSLFLSTEKADPALAKKLYPAAEEALLEGKYYEVAGRYVDPATEMQRATETYRNMAKRPPRDGMDMSALNERYFATASGRLVSLLVRVNRKEDAERAAEQALAVSSSETVKATLERARQGEMPEPFITRQDRQNLKNSM